MLRVMAFALMVLMSGVALSAGNEQDNSRVTISYSPLTFNYFSVHEFIGELALSDYVSIAGIFGSGSITDDVTEENMSITEYGLQLTIYPVGSFGKGTQIGLEFNNVKANNGKEGQPNRFANQMGMGPYFGYKLTKWNTVSLISQVGFLTFFTYAQDPVSKQDKYTYVDPTGVFLRLNIGYTF
ncbi:MAG: hypothetical protein OEZ47_07190 [Gammaproteobacteria bacterium]|nr:hypothetical protein [Gammaproteobacteria bacterium]